MFKLKICSLARAWPQVQRFAPPQRSPEKERVRKGGSGSGAAPLSANSLWTCVLLDPFDDPGMCVSVCVCVCV
jgi:hypothetical protein